MVTTTLHMIINYFASYNYIKLCVLSHKITQVYYFLSYTRVHKVRWFYHIIVVHLMHVLCTSVRSINNNVVLHAKQ